MFKSSKRGKILIGIGSNLRGHMNNPKDNLKIVFNYLQRNGLRVEKFSKTYISRPYPKRLGPLFYNSVVLIKSDMYANDILNRLKKIEILFGRRNTIRNSPRVLDLDLIDCRGEVKNLKNKLILPHPRLYLRDFVLYPILEINPMWKDPISYRNIRSLLNMCLINNLNNIRMNTISYLHL